MLLKCQKWPLNIQPFMPFGPIVIDNLEIRQHRGKSVAVMLQGRGSELAYWREIEDRQNQCLLDGSTGPRTQRTVRFLAGR